MRTRIAAAIGLAMALTACGNGAASARKPPASTPQFTPTTISAVLKPTPTTDVAAASVRSRYPQFASVDDSTVDEMGATVCRAARADRLDVAISASQTNFQMSEAEATEFTHAVVNTYCSDVPLPAVSTAPQESATTITAGTWFVGKDIQAGTYETTTVSTSALDSCYWARLSGTSGETSEILANGNVEGHGIVTIKPTDVAFQTRCTWTKTD